MSTETKTWQRFARVFRTRLLSPIEAAFVADRVRVEIFRGSRTYEKWTPRDSVLPKGETKLSAAALKYTVPGGASYIEIAGRTKNPYSERFAIEAQVESVVTAMAAITSPKLFHDEAFSGWLVSPGGNEGSIGFWFQTADRVTVDPLAIKSSLETYYATIRKNPLVGRRLHLMSKLFCRALALPPGEEQFLWLWLVLEVFPMESTTDIGPVSRLIAPLVGLADAEVKSRLGIGRLFGQRSDLVHNGAFSIPPEQINRQTLVLEAIDITAIRFLAGLPYAGTLDEFLNGS